MNLLKFDAVDLVLVPVALLLRRYHPGRHRRTAEHTARRELRTVIRGHRPGHRDWIEVRAAGWSREPVTA